jgi:hypothetical protein
MFYQDSHVPLQSYSSSEVLGLPGVLIYGQTRDAAIAHAQALALRVLADRLEHGEAA